MKIETRSIILYWRNYKINTLWEVFKNSWIIQKQTINKDWYCVFWIWNKTYYIHRLVAETFFSNPENKRTVNHRDGNRSNNWLHKDWKHNLEWATDKENIQHSFDELWRKPNLSNLYMGIKWWKNKLSKKVWQYDLSGNLIKLWDCQIEIQRNLWFKHQNISKVCKWEYSQSYWYIRKHI